MVKKNERIFEFTIKDSNTFKIVIETLSKIVSDATWTFDNTTENKFKGIEIEDYPKLYPEEIEKNKREFRKRMYER